MSSLYQEKNGNWALQVTVDSKRHTLRLGALSKTKATKFQTFVDEMVEHHRYGTQPNRESEVAKWLSNLSREMAERLERIGLLTLEPSAKLGEYLEGFIAERRSQYKPTSITVWEQTVRNLLRYFGADADMPSITRDDAVAFREHLLIAPNEREGDKPLSKTSVAKRLQNCRMFFAEAVKRGVIDESPFDGVRQREGNCAERLGHVPVETIHTVAGYLPNHWWRLLLTLARFQGLRTPSEPLVLKWRDVDLEGGKLTITSPKTSHHADGGTRVMPIFRETRAAFVEALQHRDESDGEFVFPAEWRQRAKGGYWKDVNMRTTIMKAIKRAGMKPWVKLLHNLRASCETDLLNCGLYSPQTIARWLGHSVAVQGRHYACDVPSDFEVARNADIFSQTAHSAQNADELIQGEALHSKIEEPNADIVGENTGQDTLRSALQKARQYPPKMGQNMHFDTFAKSVKYLENAAFLYAAIGVHPYQLEAAGIEPASRNRS